MNDPELLNRVLAPCNQEMKRRYAPLNNASHQKGRLYPRKGWSPEAGKAPLGAVIPKRPVPEASWVRRKAIFNGRKLRRAFSDLFLSFTKEKTCTSSASAAAQTKEKAYLVQVRTIQYWRTGVRSAPVSCPRAPPGRRRVRLLPAGAPCTGTARRPGYSSISTSCPHAFERMMPSMIAWL